MKTAIYLVCIFFSVGTSGYCQMQSPQSPHFPSQQPVYGSNYSNSNLGPHYSQTGQIQMGATAQDINNQRNNYGNRAGLPPQQAEVEAIIRDYTQNKQKYQSIDQVRSNASTDHIPVFNTTLKELNEMLSGKVKLSVADAFYSIEAAFGNAYLSKQQYKDIIANSADFIKTWMLQNGLDVKDNYMVQYSIQKFMSEQLVISKTKTNKDGKLMIDQVQHQPFHYDYNDYQARNDYRNMFLTKCLATGFGQCNSMPLVYLVLAESLGVKAYLSFAPNHAFIKYPDNSGYVMNYEPTSNWQISDKWYKDNMFISPKAVQTGIYLDTLNAKQIVANSIFDLACEYMILDKTGKEDFILNCLKSGNQYFPKNNNLTSLFIYSMHLKTMLREVMRTHQLRSFDEIATYPEANRIYKEYLAVEDRITKLGYQDMPSGMYEEMLNQQEFKGKIQKDYQISGKDKRNLFTNLTSNN